MSLPPPEADVDVDVQLAEAVETLRAIRAGEVDALLLADGQPGAQVFTLSSADRPYRMFVENMRDGAATVSDSGIVLYANRRLAELLSMPLSSLIGTPLAAIVAAEDRATLASQAQLGGGVSIEIDLLDTFGRAIPVRVGGSTLDVDSELLTCLTFADLTKDRQHQDELTRAHAEALEGSRLKSEFVANMSHEIRTPLNGVIGMSGLLLGTVLTDEQREYADAVKASGDALLGVIEDILDFSKIEAGKLELDVHPFELLALVEEVCSIVSAPGHAKGVELLSWVDPVLPALVSGDSTRVRQVLTNLMTNAVKFTASGEVSAQVTGQPDGSAGWQLRFVVTDTGIGVGPASVDKIFESFLQADGSTTRQYGGTGLGLTISKQLVALMGGHIGVDSIEGEGSAFWFSLPVQEATGEPTTEPAQTLGAGGRVLVVDDNATSRGLLELRLSAWSLRCDTAANGDAAMDLLRTADRASDPYRLVLLDEGMPGMTGTELTSAIRASSSERRVPVLMILSSQAERGDGTTAGVDGFLTKPVRQARLRAGIAQLLDPAGWAADLDARAAERSDMAAAAPSPGGEVDGSQVLLVEDNIINQLVATRMLEKRGLLVDVAANGRVALEMVAQSRYDAIFMDCHMPELDGYEATAEIRRSGGENRDAPIIAMTANAVMGDREKCLAAGMDDYVAKPLDARSLDDAVARSAALNQARRRRGAEPAETGGAPPAAANDAPQVGAPEVEVSEVPPPEPEVALLDPLALDELCGDDVALKQDLVAMFVDQAQGGLADIARAIRNGDGETLHLDAHRLKGSSASLGALRVAELCDQLCAVGRENRMAAAPTLLEHLELALQLTRESWFAPIAPQ